MADNPYNFSGFDEGFAKGLDIVWRMQDRKNSEKDRERRIKMEDRAAAREEEDFGLRKRKYENELAAAATPEEAKAARKADLEYKQVSTAIGQENLTASRNQRKAVSADARLEQLEQYGPHISTLIRDKEWLENGAKWDAFLNGGQWDPEETQESMMKKGIDFVNKAKRPSLERGIGDTISPSTAKEQKVPEGSKVTNKRVKNLLINPKGYEGFVVVELEVEVEKDGKKYKYDAPVTANRTDAPDDEVLLVPMEEFSQLAQAGGTLRKALKDIEMQGGTADDLDAFIKANTVGIKDKQGRTAKRGRSKIYQEAADYAEVHGTTLEEAYEIVETKNTERRLGTEMASIRKSEQAEGWTEEQIRHQAMVNLGLKKASDVPQAATDAEGWSVQVVGE